MRILFLVPYTPTLIRTRPYNLLRALAQRGHTVTLGTLWETKDERRALAEFEKLGVRVIAQRLTKVRATWNMLRAVLTHVPLQSAYCWQPQLFQALISNFQLPTSNFDVLHVEHLRGARYGLNLQSAIRHLPSALPIIWDSVDCIAYLFEQAAQHSAGLFGRWVTRFELGRTRQYEGMLAHQFDRVLVTSSQDAAALIELKKQYAAGNKLDHASRITKVQPPAPNFQFPISVLPNGVDLNYFTPPAQPRDPNTIVFSGKMSYHANIAAAIFLVNEIMPGVWRERPGTRLVIAGKDPAPSVRRLARDERIQVTGTVADIRPHLMRASVAVCPVQYSAGIQNKVLEPMACATPVVASPQAVAALQTVNGRDLVVANGAPAIAAKIVEMLNSATMREQIGNAGRQYVEQNHNWLEIVGRLEKIYLETIEGYGARG